MSSSIGSQHRIMSSMHNDVLEAPIPESEEGKESLLAELKNRAKGAVLTNTLPDALLLYEKAVKVKPNDATLYCNQSLVHFNMGQFEMAKDAAETAIIKDFNYVKAYWRAGQALTKLDQYEKAHNLYEQALKLDPNNKAVQKELTKIQKLNVEFKQRKLLGETTRNKTEPSGSDAFKKTANTETIRLSSVSDEKKIEKPDLDHDDTVSNNNEEHTFTKSEHVKGYKIVNGKKTTFFHNELSEEAKHLIGDIAPKRLDTTVVSTITTEKNENTSVWNTAGTWEERDVTSWAKKSLEQFLLKTSYTLDDTSPAPDASVTITRVTKCDGHASFATVRGKKRYIYEFLVMLEWKLTFASSNNSDTAEGTMTFPDFDGTCPVGEGYDLGPYEVKSCTDSNLVPILDRFVRNGGLRICIHTAFDDWVQLFKETY